MRPLWITIDDLAGSASELGWFSLSSDGARHLCRGCGETFEQSESGWDVFRKHRYERHETVERFEAAELDGLRVTMRVITRQETDWSGKIRTETEFVAVADDGTIYFPDHETYDWLPPGGHKWRPKPGSDLLRLMPGVPVSPSNG